MERRLRTIEQVLELKELREEEIAAEVRRTQERIAYHEAELAALERSYLDAFAAFDRMRERGPVEAHTVGLYYGYMLQLLSEMEERRRRLAQCLEELRRRREALVEALRERKAFEILKGREERERAREEGARERREMDAVALARRTAR